MKKLMNFWLMAALVCGLGLSVTSCKDDDDDSKSEEQQQQEQEQTASKFWSVVGQLVSSDDYTADYEDKTFEPVYGIADATNATTRIVETNDMQTAARRFSDLVGASIDENTPSYTYSDPDVGTLTYTRGGSANDWATVDVNIKQIPSLRTIIYRQGDGTNAAAAQKAWYRFGDVVSRTVNEKVEYWICVRPAFSPEDKSDSHWVCLNSLPTKNIFNFAYQSKTWTVPKGINTDKENMQNLAEMLYAMTNPKQWYENANTYHTDGKLWGFSGLPIFADFKKANLMYHNEYFWQNVAAAWTKHGIAEKAMIVDLGDLADRINRDGINLLYNGYSWWSTSSWNCTLYQASYTNGTANDKKNLHQASYTEVKKSMENIKFDCTQMGANTANYKEFFGDDKYRWVVRHATGKVLNGGIQPAPTAQLQGGCTDVYRYYAEYPSEWTREDPKGGNGPEVTPDPDARVLSDFSGIPYYMHGDILQDQYGHKWIVVDQAGNPDKIGYIGEKSPYSELISFEGLKFSDDKKKALNLPTRSQAIRGTFWLEAFYNQLANNTTNTKEDLINVGKFAQWGSSWWNLLENCDVEIRDYFQRIWAQSNNPRQNTLAASIAYDDGTGQQRLLRWIRNNQVEGENMYYYLSDNYVNYPDATTQLYPAEAYSNFPIYLDDLTKEEMVKRYAEDTYARQGLSPNDNLSNTTDKSPRQPRSAIDERAKDVSNYVYNRSKWESRTFGTDMWNAPILMFRMTRVYDRGPANYSTTTEDGLTLTRIAQHDWTGIDDEDTELNISNFRESTMNVIWSNCYDHGVNPNNWFLNGKKMDFPTWRTAW